MCDFGQPREWVFARMRDNIQWCSVVGDVMDFSFWIAFFFAGLGLPFTLYVILQVLGLFLLKGKARLVLLILAAVMGLVVIIAVLAYLEESNLWPIWLIFCSPAAIVCIAIVWLLSRPSK